MNQKMKNEMIKLFWIFVVVSLIGCIVETIVCIVQEGHFEVRQGVIYGPFIPVYGVGAIMFYIFVPKIIGATTKNTDEIKSMKIFLYTAILGGITEYIFSYAQECIFGTVSWEYSHLPFNINGRTGLIHCIYWGLGGILFIKWLYPYTEKINEINYTSRNMQIITSVFIIFMIFNVSVSMLAGYRQYERTMNIEADTHLKQFLDKYYPDSVMDRIYANKQNKQDLNRTNSNHIIRIMPQNI